MSKKKKIHNPVANANHVVKQTKVNVEDMSWWQRYRAWRKRANEIQEEKRRRRGWLLDWTYTIIEVVLIVFVIRVTTVEAFRIPTGSMENTLLVGDFLLVNKFVYGIRSPDWLGIPFTDVGFRIPYTRLPAIKDPKPGDILVFRYPHNQRINYIKRCVAIGGQTVELKNKKLFVDGEEVSLPQDGKFADPRIIPKGIKMPQIMPHGAGNKDNYGPVTVPEGYYMMMGDNRDNSADSRFWGFLDKRLVLGKALVIYFSWDKTTPLYRFWEFIRWERFLKLIK
ncbi:signal peptidase I [Calditrichota bacterium]